MQQTKLAWSSMNSGDVFILDGGMKIWLWLGSSSGRVERIKGFEVARRIRDEERGGKAELIDFGIYSKFKLRICQVIASYIILCSR